MRKTSILVNIPLRYLDHHPDNPRKDLGDLSELIESVKANGILQNLSVVSAKDPIFWRENIENYTEASELEADIEDMCDVGEFYVMIGNRRYEAAKEAGLDSVPCRIEVGLTKADQVSIMLEENLQRNDLTIPEQAYGFQQLIDLGESVEAISEKTGFSQSTIYRRLHIAELPRDAVEDAVDKYQLTFKDFQALEEVEDPKEKERILKNNADSIAYAVNAYKRQKNAEEWEKNLLSEVEKVCNLSAFPEDEHTWDDWWDRISTVSTGEELDLSDFPSDDVYYQKGYNGISFYTLDEVAKEESEKKASEVDELRKENNRKKITLDGLMEDLYNQVKSWVLYLKDEEDEGRGAEVTFFDNEIRDLFSIYSRNVSYGACDTAAEYLGIDFDELQSYSPALQMVAFVAQDVIVGSIPYYYSLKWSEDGSGDIREALDVFEALGLKYTIDQSRMDEIDSVLTGTHPYLVKES